MIDTRKVQLEGRLRNIIARYVNRQPQKKLKIDPKEEKSEEELLMELFSISRVNYTFNDLQFDGMVLELEDFIEHTYNHQP